MSYSESKEWLFSLRFAMKGFDLKKIKKLIKYSKIDLQKLKTIHVAGSNGKGSTSAFISNILTEQGYKTGLYTSPHLVEPTERIRINGLKISQKKFTQLTNYYKNLMKRKKFNANFFEVITTIAFNCFYDKKVDFLVAETGLGGRLDATNVLDGIVNIITNISLEHTQYLGNSISKIAGEKAGIIKENSGVVISKSNSGLKAVQKKAKEQNAQLYYPKFKIKKASNKEQVFELLKPGKISNLKIKLIGSHQCENAALAVTAALALREHYPVSNKAIKKGLLKTDWKGRVQKVKEKPLVILDSAHNKSGWEALFNALKFFKFKKVFIVLGTMEDKDTSFLKKKLKNHRVFLTKIDFYRASEPKALRKKLGFGTIIQEPEEALETALKEASKKDLVLVTGSIFVVGKVFETLKLKV